VVACRGVHEEVRARKPREVRWQSSKESFSAVQS
jgi:hypothetical protein